METKTNERLFLERVKQTAEEMGIEHYLAYASDEERSVNYFNGMRGVDFISLITGLADGGNETVSRTVLAAASLVEAKLAKKHAKDEEGKEAGNED